MNSDAAVMTTPRCVLFVHQSAELYGSDKVLLYLAAGLAREGRYRPIVVLPERGPLWDALQVAGVEVHVGEIAKIRRSVFTPLGVLGLLRKAWRSVADIDAIVAGREVALVHSNTLAVLAGAVWARRRRVKHLWHVHEIVLSPRIVSWGFPRLLRWGADLVMSNSTLTQAWLLVEQPALADWAVVVFNGLPEQPPADAADVAAFRALTQAAPDDRLVVLAGRINAWKGQALLVDAAAELRRRGLASHTHFAVVGDPPPGHESLLSKLKDQVRSAGLDGVFSFVPFVEDIRCVWQASTVAVVPSTEPEPFGMVAIEAMAAGVPVVAAAHGGLLDIVEHERSGLLFEPRNAVALADALQRLLDDESLRRRLGEAGQQRQQQRFSAHSQVLATQAAYDRLCGRQAD